MLKFVLRVVIYFVCFLFSLYGLRALDFNRFIKQGKVAEANILYFIVALIMAYLLGSFLMSIIYYFQV